jgi:hypothetical protein
LHLQKKTKTKKKSLVWSQDVESESVNEHLSIFYFFFVNWFIVFEHHKWPKLIKNIFSGEYFVTPRRFFSPPHVFSFSFHFLLNFLSFFILLSSLMIIFSLLHYILSIVSTPQCKNENMKSKTKQNKDRNRSV